MTSSIATPGSSKASRAGTAGRAWEVPEDAGEDSPTRSSARLTTCPTVEPAGATSTTTPPVAESAWATLPQSSPRCWESCRRAGLTSDDSASPSRVSTLDAPRAISPRHWARFTSSSSLGSSVDS